MLRTSRLPAMVPLVTGLLVVALTGCSGGAGPSRPTGGHRSGYGSATPARGSTSAAGSAAVAGDGSPRALSPSRVASVLRLLDVRAAAVLAHDRGGWLSGIDPSATAFAGHETDAWSGLSRLPFARWAWHVDGLQAFDARSTGQHWASDAAAGDVSAAVADVTLRYRISGADDVDVVRRQSLLVVQRAEGELLRATGPESLPDPWDLGRVQVAVGAHSIVVVLASGSGAASGSKAASGTASPTSAAPSGSATPTSAAPSGSATPTSAAASVSASPSGGGGGPGSGRPGSGGPGSGGPVTGRQGTGEPGSGGQGSGEATLSDWSALADASAARVDAVWGTGWPRRPVVVVPADVDQLGALLGRGAGDTAGLSSLAAVTSGLPAQGDSLPTGTRVIVNPTEFAELSDAGRGVVLTHELTHVATRDVSAARAAAVPDWLSEGVADFTGYRDSGVGVESAAAELLAQVRATGAPASLPSDAEFDVHEGGSPQAYESAWLACRMLAARYGEATLVRLYRTVQREGLARALRDVIGLDPAGLTRAWRAYLGRVLRTGT